MRASDQSYDANCARCGVLVRCPAAKRNLKFRKVYCSQVCWYNRNKSIEEVPPPMGIRRKCEGCGREYVRVCIPVEPKRKFCSRVCYASTNVGEGHHQWRGGRWTTKEKGYVYLTLPGNTHRAEHVLIAEQVLGRRLKKNEVVHHINADKMDNRNDNLLICDKGYHQRLHMRMSELYQQEHFGREINA